MAMSDDFRIERYANAHRPSSLGALHTPSSLPAVWNRCRVWLGRHTSIDASVKRRSLQGQGGQCQQDYCAEREDRVADQVDGPHTAGRPIIRDRIFGSTLFLRAQSHCAGQRCSHAQRECRPTPPWSSRSTSLSALHAMLQASRRDVRGPHAGRRRGPAARCVTISRSRAGAGQCVPDRSPEILTTSSSQEGSTARGQLCLDVSPGLEAMPVSLDCRRNRAFGRKCLVHMPHRPYEVPQDSCEVQFA